MQKGWNSTLTFRCVSEKSIVLLRLSDSIALSVTLETTLIQWCLKSLKRNLPLKCFSRCSRCFVQGKNKSFLAIEGIKQWWMCISWWEHWPSPVGGGVEEAAGSIHRCPLSSPARRVQEFSPCIAGEDFQEAINKFWSLWLIQLRSKRFYVELFKILLTCRHTSVNSAKCLILPRSVYNPYETILKYSAYYI